MDPFNVSTEKAAPLNGSNQNLSNTVDAILLAEKRRSMAATDVEQKSARLLSATPSEKLQNEDKITAKTRKR